MKKTIIILSVLAFIAGSCNNRRKDIEKMDKYVGIYEYVYPYSSEENHYIVLTEDDGKIIGFYYGTSDEFDEVREGYAPGFFVVPMDNLEIKGDTIQFVLNVGKSDFLSNPVGLQITSTQKALDKGNESWANNLSPESKKYLGIISIDKGTIFFKEESYWAGDRVFVKKNLDEIQPRRLEDLLPSNDEVILEKIFGDLNGDHEPDVVLITKQTKKDAFETFDGENYDRNRRGISIAFKKGNFYELVMTMPDCFECEPDAYYMSATVLSTKIEKGKLFLDCSYGRYGSRSYTFRYQNECFELIGYDSYDREDREQLIEKMTSINFLSKKMQKKTFITSYVEGEEGTEKKETWHNIEIQKLAKLSDINDFDKFNIDNYYTEK